MLQLVDIIVIYYYFVIKLISLVLGRKYKLETIFDINEVFFSILK